MEEKKLITDGCFYYLGLRILYIRMCQQCSQIKLIKKNTSQLKELIHTIKPENMAYIYKQTKDLKSSEYQKSVYEKIFNCCNLVFSIFLNIYDKKNRFEFLIDYIDNTIAIYHRIFKDDTLILSYLYFNIALILVEHDKILTGIHLLNISLDYLNDKSHVISAKIYYNLGLLYYSLDRKNVGINYFEQSIHMFMNSSNSKYVPCILAVLTLAYIDTNSLRKAFLTSQTALSLSNNNSLYADYNLLMKLKMYSKFIIDFIETEIFFQRQDYGMENLIESDEKTNHFELNFYKLIDSIKNLPDKNFIHNLVNSTFSQALIDIEEFLYSLKNEQIRILNEDNPFIIVKKRKECENEIGKNNVDLLNISLTELEKTQNEMNFIEFKRCFIESLNYSQREKLKTMNYSLMKRDILLRNRFGEINHLNLNFHPTYSYHMHKIIQNTVSNFFTNKTLYHSKKIQRDSNYVANPLLRLSNYINKHDTLINYIKEKLKYEGKKVDGMLENPLKKKEYSVFLVEMMRKLRLNEDPDALNSIFFRVFNILSDKEIEYLIKHPELFHEFYVNDTNLFLKRKKQSTKSNFEILRESLNDDDFLNTQRKNNIFEAKIDVDFKLDNDPSYSSIKKSSSLKSIMKNKTNILQFISYEQKLKPNKTESMKKDISQKTPFKRRKKSATEISDNDKNLIKNNIFRTQKIIKLGEVKFQIKDNKLLTTPSKIKGLDTRSVTKSPLKTENIYVIKKNLKELTNTHNKSTLQTLNEKKTIDNSPTTKYFNINISPEINQYVKNSSKFIKSKGSITDIEKEKKPFNQDDELRTSLESVKNFNKVVRSGIVNTIEFNKHWELTEEFCIKLLKLVGNKDELIKILNDQVEEKVLVSKLFSITQLNSRINSFLFLKKFDKNEKLLNDFLVNIKKWISFYKSDQRFLKIIKLINSISERNNKMPIKSKLQNFIKFTNEIKTDINQQVLLEIKQKFSKAKQFLFDDLKASEADSISNSITIFEYLKKNSQELKDLNIWAKSNDKKTYEFINSFYLQALNLIKQFDTIQKQFLDVLDKLSKECEEPNIKMIKFKDLHSSFAKFLNEVDYKILK